MRLSTASLFQCLFVSVVFVFLPVCLLVSVFLSLFICFFGCYSVPVIIFAKWLYCYFKFWFFIFISHHLSSFTSFFSFIHWWRIRDTEFDRHGLRLPVRFMGKLFKVSTHHFVIFVFQRVTFYFYLFACFKLSFATTTCVDTCICLSFDVIYLWSQGENGCRPYL